MVQLFFASKWLFVFFVFVILFCKALLINQKNFQASSFYGLHLDSDKENISSICKFCYSGCSFSLSRELIPSLIELSIGNTELLFEEATRIHEQILQDLHQNPGDSKRKVELVCKFYKDCQQQVSEALAERHQSYDLTIIYLSIIGILMVLLHINALLTICDKPMQIYIKYNVKEVCADLLCLQAFMWGTSG